MVSNFVRVSYDLQLAGSRLWAGPGLPDFRHHKNGDFLLVLNATRLA